MIIDDEPLALDKLRSYVEKIPFLELVADCASPTDAMEILASEHIDLIITDIQMPDINGLELLKSLVKSPYVIFTTAYADYAVESYKFATVDYLLKPYRFIDLQRAVNRAMDAYQRSRAIERHPEEGSIFIKVENKYIRVKLSDIRYIKGYGEYLQIFITDTPKPLLTISSFAAIRDRLTPNFLQIHRSYIVNMNQIVHVERNRVVMDEDTFLPISDTYMPEFRLYLQNNSVGTQNSKL